MANALRKMVVKGRDIFGLLQNEIDNRRMAPCSQLIVNSDAANWVLDTEARGVRMVGQSLGIPVRIGHAMRRRNACIHYMSQYALSDPKTYLSAPGCRYSLAYFHGGPEEPKFKELFVHLERCGDLLHKIHVSNSTMSTACQTIGFTTDQIAYIPIGLNLSWFPSQTESRRRKVRARMGIADDAFLVGSFQKDGDGWGEGLTPKLIKGPDVFVAVMKKAKENIPPLHVLLGGVSRGYVKKGLERAGVPYTEAYAPTAQGVGELYQALDLYLVASRIEGGPKALLESMASGIPLVTTRVGQAVDLVRHGENAWMVESEDVVGLTEGVVMAYENLDWFAQMKETARATAAAEDYLAQAGRWKERFFSGYIEGQ